MLSFLSALSAENVPSFESISDSILFRFEKIKDYEVDVKISVKMTGFRMPKKKVKVFFKHPDKTKVETFGFAIVPKTGLAGNPHDFLKLVSEVSEILSVSGSDGKILISGKVNADSLDIPMDVSEDEIPEVKIDLMVDEKYWVITKAEVYLDAESVFTITMNYLSVDGFRVPEKTEFALGLKGISKWTTRDPFGGPDDDRHDFDSIAKSSGFDPEKDEIAGKVTMKFSGYKINRGIEDSFFIEED